MTTPKMPKRKPARSLKILLDGDMYANVQELAQRAAVPIDTVGAYLVTMGFATMVAQSEADKLAEDAKHPAAPATPEPDYDDLFSLDSLSKDGGTVNPGGGSL